MGQYSGAAALKSGPQIATKTGNPAGLLLRRIWYSLGKSGVLGITEYRQDRPLFSIQHNMIAQTSELKRLQIGRQVQTSSASTQTSSASTRISSVKFCFNSDTFGFNSDKFGFNSDKFGQVLLQLGQVLLQLGQVLLQLGQVRLQLGHVRLQVGQVRLQLG